MRRQQTRPLCELFMYVLTAVADPISKQCVSYLHDRGLSKSRGHMILSKRAPFSGKFNNILIKM